MIMEFYELKYRVLQTFYNVLYEESYEYEQAAGRTYYEFHQEMNDKEIEHVIIVITVGARLLKHKAVSEYHLNYIKEAISIFNNIDVKSKLTEDEYEVLCEEITGLKIDLNI